MNKVVKLSLWALIMGSFFVVGEFGPRGLLVHNSSLKNILLMGGAGGFLGLVFGLMAEAAKKQKQHQERLQFNIKRAAKRYTGILARGYLILLPLMVVSIGVVILKPFGSWLDYASAYFILFIFLLYYMFIQRKKVSQFYGEEIGIHYAYRFAGKDFFIMVILIVLGIGLVAFGAYYFFAEKPNRAEQIVKIQNDVPSPKEVFSSEYVGVNWKIYKDEEYGFAINYPSYWSFERYPAINAVGFGTHPVPEGVGDAFSPVEVRRLKSSLAETIKYFESSQTIADIKKESIIIDGLPPAIKIEGLYGGIIGPAEIYNGSKIISVLIAKDDFIYQISFTEVATNDKENLANYEIFNEMVTAFKLLE